MTMQTVTATRIADGAAVPVSIETQCTITAPDGTPITAGGAFVSDDLVRAYLQPNERNAGGGKLTTWHGEPIGQYWTVSTHTRWSRFGPYTMRHIGAYINGRHWHGKLNDDGQLVTLRPYKHQ